MLEENEIKKNEQVLNYLNQLFPNPKCELNFSSPFELLVAVILSAQCTDKRVNVITQTLFKTHNTPRAFSEMSQETLEKQIYSCGFYHNKAKNIISASKDILNNFDGNVPDNINDLTTLAGVGRKTANVVYSIAFNGNAIAVDTHVFRVSNRLGLVSAKTADECERMLMQRFPESIWSKIHYQMVLFGRYKCTARAPECETCDLKNICDYYNNLKIK